MVEQHGRYAGHLMALGLEPGPKSQRGKLFSSLPLIRHDQFEAWYWSEPVLGKRIIAELKQKVKELEQQGDKSVERPWVTWWARIKTAWSRGTVV